MAFSVYAHLTPTSSPTQVLETVKLRLQSVIEESKEGSGPMTISALARSIESYLKAERDDGNKIYHVEKVCETFGGSPLAEDALLSSFFEEGSDVFALIRIEID